MELTAAEGRVLGCLIEQAAIDPDAYPVTLNDLRLACNQAEGRQPIVAYGDRTVEDTLLALKSKGLARFVSPSHDERSTRYSHRADHRWRMSPAELAVLSVLLLGGQLTLGAVQARASRLHPFGGAGEVEAVLDALAARTPSAFAARLDGPVAGPRARWAQALVDDPFEDDVAVPDHVPGPGGSRAPMVIADRLVTGPTYAELAARVAELERRLAAASERPPAPGATGPAAAGGSGTDDWARTHPYSRADHDRNRRGPDRRWAGTVDGERALPAGPNTARPPGVEPDALAVLLDRLADIEARVARIEAELGALR